MLEPLKQKNMENVKKAHGILAKAMESHLDADVQIHPAEWCFAMGSIIMNCYHFSNYSYEEACEETKRMNLLCKKFWEHEKHEKKDTHWISVDHEYPKESEEVEVLIEGKIYDARFYKYEDYRAWDLKKGQYSGTVIPEFWRRKISKKRNISANES